MASPGLAVMGGDSRSKGRWFESRRRILDGHEFFFALICCKNCIVCMKRPNRDEKEARDGPFKKRWIAMVVAMVVSVIAFYFDNPSLNSAQVYLQFLPICNLIEKNGNKRKRGRRRSVNKLINALRLSLNYNIGIIQNAILHSIAIVERL